MIPNFTIMTNLPLYKRFSAFGLALVLFSLPLFFLLEIETAHFLKNLQVFYSDEGVLCVFFLTGIVFFYLGIILRKFNKA